MTSAPVLKGKVALITGLTNENSVAFKIAKELRASGAEIVFTVPSAKLQRVNHNQAIMVDADLYNYDITNSDELEDLLDILEADFGTVDLLVHCLKAPTLAAARGDVFDLGHPDFIQMLDEWVWSTIQLISSVEPLLEDGARVVICTPEAPSGAFSIVKAALTEALDRMRAEVADDIRIITVGEHASTAQELTGLLASSH